jgi:hypothetical protein
VTGIMRILRSGIGILTIAILAPLCLCVAVPTGINEVKATGWAALYDSVKHPEATARIALRYGITKISNGDNCDFVLTEARSYREGQEDAIRAFYDASDDLVEPLTRRLHPGFNEELVRDIGFVLNTRRELSREMESIDHGPYYVLEVYAVVPSAPPLIDWRCP